VFPLEAGGVFEAPLEAGGVFEAPLEAGGVFEAPLDAGGVFEAPLDAGGVFDAPLEAGVLSDDPLGAGDATLSGFEAPTATFTRAGSVSGVCEAAVCGVSCIAAVPAEVSELDVSEAPLNASGNRSNPFFPPPLHAPRTRTHTIIVNRFMLKASTKVWIMLFHVAFRIFCVTIVPDGNFVNKIGHIFGNIPENFSVRCSVRLPR